MTRKNANLNNIGIIVDAILSSCQINMSGEGAHFLKGIISWGLSYGRDHEGWGEFIYLCQGVKLITKKLARFQLYIVSSQE